MAIDRSIDEGDIVDAFNCNDIDLLEVMRDAIDGAGLERLKASIGGPDDAADLRQLATYLRELADEIEDPRRHGH